jgi:hypothetical protein
MAKSCSIEGCENPHTARGWCGMHCERWRRYGDPLVLVGKGRPTTDALERFWSKVVSTDDCWLWTAKGVDLNGYAKFWMPTKTWRAHRFAYEEFVGPIPEGMVLDHICHTNSDCAGGPSCLHRRCVNPAHLEPVPSVANLHRRARRWTGTSQLGANYRREIG